MTPSRPPRPTGLDAAPAAPPSAGGESAAPPERPAAGARWTLWLLIAVLAAAFALRLASAEGRYLNGDEVIYVQLAAHSRLAAMYRESARTAHPPLYFAALAAWERLGRSEVFLRFLSVLAGTATVALLFVWTRNLFGEAAGLAAAGIAAVTPILVDLSSQVRGYAALMLFIALAAVFQERFLRRRRGADLAISAGAMAVAVLTEYCAVFAAAALGAVALLHIARRELDRREVARWIAAQAAILAVVGVLAVLEVARLRGGPLEQGVQEGMLRSSYHNPLRESAAAFAVVNTARMAVEFLGLYFARRWQNAGPLPTAVALFAAAGAVAWTAIRARGSSGLDAIVAAAVAFGLTAVAGLARLYPYGPTRHDSFLLLFLLPLAGLVVSMAVRRRAAVAFALVAAWGVYQWSTAEMQHLVRPEPVNRIETMRAAASALKQEIVPGVPIFTDRVGSRLLGYYLADGSPPRVTPLGPRIPRMDFDTFSVVVGGMTYTFAGDPEIFLQSLALARGRNGLPPSFVVFVGGSPHLSDRLPGVSRVHRFGPHIEFFTHTPIGG